YNKFSIWALLIVGLTTITVLAGFTVIKKMLFDLLPTWEVNDPVSKVFVMDEIPPTTGSLAAGDSTVPNEYLVDPAIDTLLLLMETQGVYFHKTGSRPSGIVGPNDVVILKGNFQWSGRSTTSTDRIKGVIWQILQHPDGFTGEILVGDNTQWKTIDEDDNNSEDQDQCIIDVINTFYAKGYPVYLMNWTDITHNVVTEYSDGDYNDGYIYDDVSKISYPKFQTDEGTYVSLKYGIWDSTLQAYDLDRLCLINLPVPKTHGYSGATIAIKNWIGVLTTHDFNTRYGGGHEFHYDYCFSSFALVAKVMMVTFPKLTIVDAEWTNPNGNQPPNSSVQTKMLLGSTDPLAASWYTAKYILAPISSNSIDPDNPNGRYHEVITNWANCFQDSGFAVTKDSTDISVFDRTTLSGSSTFYLSVSILDGWNIVSIPGFHPSNQNVLTWWAGNDPTTSVFKYSSGYKIITTCTPGEGYWMKHLGANEYNTGDEWPAGGIKIVAHNPISATTGWNLIGGYENTISIGEITTTPPGLIDGLIYEYSSGYTVATNLVPGYGYWIKLNGNGQIIYPERPTSAPKMEGEKIIDEKWARVIITDSEWKEYILYTTRELESPDKYLLPPKPPAGLFDIRFNTDRFVEDISIEKTIEITGAYYPIKIRVDGMGINLKDAITGEMLNTEIADGEELVIEDSALTKLTVSSDGLRPLQYELVQNYPNPFNPSTTISYSIPATSFVTLKVYDPLGKEVATLVKKERQAGSYEVEFNAKDLTSGIYLYQLKAGKFVEAMKMILLK
ncbi:MAG: hypothetical protein DRQ13_08820, partial [Ignavibacteriae bacterium]